MMGTRAVLTSMARRRVAVAMSGGVDSSVAAYLLQQQEKYELIGLHMSNWNAQDEDDVPQQNTKRCNEQDANDTAAVCEFLGMTLHHTSFAAEYWTGVFEPFVDGIAKGHMINPDVDCNSIVKFGAMKKYAQEQLGIEWIATGHYARLWDNRNNKGNIMKTRMPELVDRIIEETPSLEWLLSYGGTTPLLLAGADSSKDQSYFLSEVNGEAFRNVLFPLGDKKKSSSSSSSSSSSTKSVRQIAFDANIPTATKPDSMGICFVGKRNFSNFISQYLPDVPRPGVFVNVDTGEVVGHHSGSLQYTIGQGAKIGGALKKWFVAGLARNDKIVCNTKKNDDSTIMVCTGTHHPSLYSDEFYIQELHWIAGEIPPPLLKHGKLRALCRTRHLQPLVLCEVFRNGNNINGQGWTVRTDRPLRATTPGQSAVIYLGGAGVVCLGGGKIWDRGPSYHEQSLDLPLTLHPAGHNDLSLEGRNEMATRS